MADSQVDDIIQLANMGGGSLMIAWQLKDKTVLIVGGGEVASQRIESVLGTDAHIIVLSPQTGLRHRTKQFIQSFPQRITYYDRRFEGPSDLQNIDLVLTAIDDNQRSREIVELCRTARVPVNAADIPDLCDFFFGAQIRDGPLQVMISTNGNGPRLSGLIKKKLQTGLSGYEGEAIKRIGELRAKLKDRAPGMGGTVGRKRMKWMTQLCNQWEMVDFTQLDEPMMQGLLDEGWEKDCIPSIEALGGKRLSKPTTKDNIRPVSFSSTSSILPASLGLVTGAVFAFTLMSFTRRPSRAICEILELYSTPFFRSWEDILSSQLPRARMELPEIPKEHFQTLCIIGTGPSGLAALKTVLDTPQFKRGTWSVEAYESRERVGGVWNPSSANWEEKEPPLTPLYDSLTTNIPHPIMAFTSYTFPPGTPLFPKAEYVQRYLEGYACHFGLERYIRLRTAVKLVERDSSKGDKWQVTLDNGETRGFDFVIVSNGHYRVPRYPDVKGLEAWRENERAWHSVWYRCPEDVMKGKAIKKVLIIGAGPSGLDISAELAASWEVIEVVHSMSGTRQVEQTTRNIRRRGRVLEFRNWESGEVLFDDGGEVEQGVDCCILATGFEMSFPFLPQGILRLQVPPSMPPIPRDLYNNTYSVVPLAKHIFPLGSNSLAFVGLPIRVAPFPLVEAQARMIVHAFAHPEALDSTREAVDVISRYEDLGGSYEKWHVFRDMEQFAYRDELYRLSDVTGTGKEGIEGRVVVADWEKEMYLKKAILRRFWVDLQEKGLADGWVRGVGEGGLEEWVQLMKRILREAEKEGVEPDDRAKL